MLSLSDVKEGEPAPQEFTRKWSAIIREWSERYKTKVSGWWFDGAYNTAGWDDLTKTHSWNSWAEACRAGNAESLLAFNPGTDPKRAFDILCGQQDYTAGEQNDWKVTPDQFPAPKGVQWQVLSFLGSTWSRADGAKDTDETMKAFARQVAAAGGSMTCDVGWAEGSHIYTPHLNQLKAISRALKEKNSGLKRIPCK